MFFQELDEKYRKMAEIKKKEQDLKEKIHLYKKELHELSQALEKGMDDIEIQNQEHLNNLRTNISELNKRKNNSFNCNFI